MIVDHLQAPYYAVIFSSILTDRLDDYEKVTHRMETLAKEQPGYLGIESARSDIGITLSYWESLDAISAWKKNVEHTEARERGRAVWYQKYQLRICKVERSYGFEKG